MSPTNSPEPPRGATAWWSTSNKRSRWTALGALVLVATLGATSAFVWYSPASPIAQVVDTVSSEVAHQQQLDAAQAEYDKKAKELQAQILDLKAAVRKKTLTATASAAKAGDLQQQLWTTQGTLKALQASRTPTKSTPPAAAAPAPSTPAAPVVETISAPSKAALTNPESKYFGLMTEQAPFNWATYDATSERVGSTPSVVGYFGGWDEAFRANAVTRAWERNTLPILTWESRPIGSDNNVVEEPDYTLPLIIGDPDAGVAGTFDDYLHQYAKDIVATGLPLGIRLDHEMNGGWYPWAEQDGRGNPVNSNNTGDYVKMWQHVHDIFAEEGANDLVIWIWAPNIINKLPVASTTQEYLTALYPGDDYVDWVGVSAYLRPTFQADNDFSFAYTFDRTLNQLRAITDKPIYLAEIGASEIGGHKATWISSLFEALAKPENADIIGFSWFNMTVTTYVQGERATNDWRIESRSDTLEAFKTGIANSVGEFGPIPQ